MGDQNSLNLSIRYKHSSHDASIKLTIHSSRNIKIGTVILNLWDDKKRLNMGLQKAKVKLEVLSTSNDCTKIEEIRKIGQQMDRSMKNGKHA